MAKRLDVYRCELCGHIIEIVNKGEGTLVCCGQNMTFLSENSRDAAVEKHVPVIEISSDGIKVKVGQVAHPMTEEHLIQWIEVIVDDKICRSWLKPGDAPEAFFKLSGSKISAREYCNLHGHWKATE
jgi:superoxide reductase